MGSFNQGRVGAPPCRFEGGRVEEPFIEGEEAFSNAIGNIVQIVGPQLVGNEAARRKAWLASRSRVVIEKHEEHSIAANRSKKTREGSWGSGGKETTTKRGRRRRRRKAHCILFNLDDRHVSLIRAQTDGTTPSRDTRLRCYANRDSRGRASILGEHGDPCARMEKGYRPEERLSLSFETSLSAMRR